MTQESKITTQEALTIISELPRLFSEQINHALDKAEIVLAKKIEDDNRPTKLAVKDLARIQPMKVIKTHWGVHNCPKCGFKFNPYQYNDKYCSKCGQRLEWA